MALNTVADYITEARRLLQDSVAPYRYPDAHFIAALNIGMSEARRLRPDLFLGRANAVPDYTATNTPVAFDVQYRSALAYYVAGRVVLADGETADETRAAAFMNRFVAQIGGLAA